MQLLYYSIFHCHLIYAVTIWSCLRSGPINDLFKLQKTAIRLISGSSYNSYTEPLFKKLKILPLPDLVAFSKVQFMQRFSQIFLPSSSMTCGFATLFGTLAITRYNYAKLQNYHSNLVKLDVFPIYSFPKIWEEFVDENIKIIRKKADFDSKFKDYFLNDLAAVISCNRLLCTACMTGRN